MRADQARMHTTQGDAPEGVDRHGVSALSGQVLGLGHDKASGRFRVAYFGVLVVPLGNGIVHKRVDLRAHVDVLVVAGGHLQNQAHPPRLSPITWQWGDSQLKASSRMASIGLQPQDWWRQYGGGSNYWWRL